MGCIRVISGRVVCGNGIRGPRGFSAMTLTISCIDSRNRYWHFNHIQFTCEPSFIVFSRMGREYLGVPIWGGVISVWIRYV